MKKYICGPGQGNLADLDMCEEECNVPEEGQAEAFSLDILYHCWLFGRAVHVCMFLTCLF